MALEGRAMPLWEIPLPVGAKNVRLELPDGTRVPIRPAFYRPGLEGDVPVLALLAGDSFVGDTLEGHWRTFRHDNPEAYAWVEEGLLKLRLVASEEGTADFLNLYSLGLLPLGAELEFSFKAEDIPSSGEHYVSIFVASEVKTYPSDGLQMRFILSANGVKAMVSKRKAGAWETLWSSPFYQPPYTANCRMRLGPEVAVELDGQAVWSGESWLSPLSWPLLWNVSRSTEPVVVSYEHLSVSLPPLRVLYELAPEDVGKSEVRIFDTIGEEDEGAWQRVLGPGHAFRGDCVLENGLLRMRLRLGEATTSVATFYHPEGEGWMENFCLKGEDWRPTVASVEKIERVTPEEVSLLVRLEQASGDRESLNRLILRLGRPLEWEALSGNPRTIFRQLDQQFGATIEVFRNDAVDPDYDAELDTDNWALLADSSRSKVALLASRQKIRLLKAHTPQIYLGETLLVACRPLDWPFLTEAELAALSAGAEVDTGLVDDSGDSVLLSSQGDWVALYLTGGSELPPGRYKLFLRAKQEGDAEGDLGLSARNLTDGRDLAVPPGQVAATPGQEFSYLVLPFEVREADEGDTLELKAEKLTAAANSIWVDYFAIIPVADGWRRPQDIAHNAMRPVELAFTIVPR